MASEKCPVMHSKGIVALYILHTLKSSPKSGYDILKEIEAKTRGAWIPSKGTVYPLLDQLEKDKLIRVKKVESRSKRTFELTAAGKKHVEGLAHAHSHAKQKFSEYRSLLVDIFGKEKADITAQLLDLKELCSEMDRNKVPSALKLLQRCAADLRRL